jgi:hypothetical protein
MRTAPLFLAGALVFAGCSGASGSNGDGTATSTSQDALRGCHGTASSAVPDDGNYFMTTFGGSNDGQRMSCGERTLNGSWYYAASRQRYGCGAHLQVTANGACVVVEADDYGPDQCVERAAGGPILDVSPVAAEALFGTDSAGWSDQLEINVVEVDPSTPLGPC